MLTKKVFKILVKFSAPLVLLSLPFSYSFAQDAVGDTTQTQDQTIPQNDHSTGADAQAVPQVDANDDIIYNSSSFSDSTDLSDSYQEPKPIINDNNSSN